MEMLDGSDIVAEETADCGCPHSDDDARSNQVDLKVEPVRTGGDFSGVGSPVLRRAALYNISDVDFIPANTAGEQETVELAAGLTVEGKAKKVFIFSGCLSD